MKRITDRRIWLGSISVWLLALLNMSSWNPWAIISLLVLVISVIAAVLSIKNKRVKAALNKWGYELEFFIVLVSGFFSGGRFNGIQTAILAVAVILFLISWLLYFRQNMHYDN